MPRNVFILALGEFIDLCSFVLQMAYLLEKELSIPEEDMFEIDAIIENLQSGIDEWLALEKELLTTLLSAEQIEVYLENMVRDTLGLGNIQTKLDKILMDYVSGPKMDPEKLYVESLPTYPM